MLGNNYFYNGSLKKVVAIFGSLFNDLYISRGKNAEKIVGIRKVPLAYAPRERYLTRLNATVDSSKDIAMKLPRMSFEISSVIYDTGSQLNRLNQTIQNDSAGKPVKIWQSSPYVISMSLNIMSRSQDEALQIVEQILPFFNPEYTLTVKGLEGPDSKSDLPITLKSVEFEDDYQGDFESGRRTIIYTLLFDIKVKFVSNQDRPATLIKSVTTNLLDSETAAKLSAVNVRTAFQSQTSDDFECITEFDYVEVEGAPLWPYELIYDDEGNIIYDDVQVIYDEL